MEPDERVEWVNFAPKRVNPNSYHSATSVFVFLNMFSLFSLQVQRHFKGKEGLDILAGTESL